MQQHNLSLNFGNARERLLQDPPQFSRLSHSIRRRRPRAGPRWNLISLSKRLTTYQVLGPIPHDGHQPSREPLRTPAFLESIQSHQKGFLCRILRIFMSSYNRQRYGVSRPLVPLDERAEGDFVTLPRPADKLTIRW